MNKTLLSTMKTFQFVDSMLFGQVRWAVSSGLSKHFVDKDGSVPLEKLAHTLMTETAKYISPPLSSVIIEHTNYKT